jgi:hypothetical protein
MERLTKVPAESDEEYAKPDDKNERNESEEKSDQDDVVGKSIRTDSTENNDNI